MKNYRYFYFLLCFFLILPCIAYPLSVDSELLATDTSLELNLTASPDKNQPKSIEIIKNIPPQLASQIKLIYPEKDLIVSDPSFQIKGTNHFLTPVFVNGSPAKVRKDGRFFYTYALTAPKSNLWITWITSDNRVVLVKRKVILLKSNKNFKAQNTYLSLILASRYFNSHKIPEPSDKVSRADFAAVMAIIASGNIPTQAKSDVFEDVPQSHWASGPISDMAEKTLLLEYYDGKFRPEAPLKKLDYIISISRLLQLNLELKPSPLPFSDIHAAHWSTKFIRSMYQNGLLPSSKQLKANQDLTWGEFIALVALIPNLNSKIPALTDFSSGFELSLEEAQNRIKPAILAVKELETKAQLAKSAEKTVVQKKAEVKPTPKPIESLYQDLKGHWVEPTAEKLKKLNILDLGNRFDPEKIVAKKEAYAILTSVLHPSVSIPKITEGAPITRIEFIALLAQLELIPTAPLKDCSRLFVDVNKAHHDRQALEKCYLSGLISADKYFLPKQFMTRAEVATLLARFPQVRKKLSNL